MNFEQPFNSKTTIRPLAVLAALCLAGCGGSAVERVPVSGQVLLDGAPLKHGTISVQPEGARMAAAKLDAEGRFSLMTYQPGDGAPIGTHPVSVNGAEQLGPYSVRWHAPPKYADASNSGIEVEITQATEDVVIEMTWDGGRPFIQKFGSGLEGEEL